MIHNVSFKILTSSGFFFFFYLYLLDYEAEAADQVPLLMRMNKDDLVLEK